MQTPDTNTKNFLLFDFRVLHLQIKDNWQLHQIYSSLFDPKMVFMLVVLVESIQ